MAVSACTNGDLRARTPQRYALFGDLGSEHISLETVEVIQTPDVIHMRFRVVK